MTIWEVVGLIGLCLGVAGAVIMFFSRPSYWVNVGTVLLMKFGPAVVKWVIGKITDRMTPEEEADLQQAIREGRGDEWVRKRMQRGHRGK